MIAIKTVNKGADANATRMHQMSKTIIVTGGCGYIGSHIARAFKYADADNRVFVIDRVKRDHTLIGLDGWFISDFADDDSLATIVDLNPDVIVHCAGTSLVGPSMRDPGTYYDNNVAKTIKMLNVLNDLEKKPLVLFSSSAAVYGEPETIPVDESAARHPISPYGKSKNMVEHILHDFWSAYKLPSVCFRFFNAAGAEPHTSDLGQEPNATHIIARVLEAQLAGKEVTINGNMFNTPDGTCIRDYVHVWDIATAHVKAADFFWGGPQPAISGHWAFNLGTNEGISNRQIVDYVDKKYGLSNILYGERRPGDPAKLVADSRNAMNFLHWEPKYSDLASIIDSAYKWYASR